MTPAEHARHVALVKASMLARPVTFKHLPADVELKMWAMGIKR